MTQIPMAHHRTTYRKMMSRNKALLDPKEYLELRRNNPGAIEWAHPVPPRVGRDKHLGKILVVFAQRSTGK